MVGLTDSEKVLFSGTVSDNIKNYKLGVSLTKRSRTSINSLINRACNDRLKLADVFFIDATRTIKMNPPMYRSSVSRSYYAMYHAARAVAFMYYQGDDHEAHNKLPTKIPDNFPDFRIWQNLIKTARLDRNKADYEPYPAEDLTYKVVAEKQLVEAKKFLREAKKYIKLKKLPS